MAQNELCGSAEVQKCRCADVRMAHEEQCGIGSLSGGARRAISGGRASVTSDSHLIILDDDELSSTRPFNVLHICVQNRGTLVVRFSITFVARVIPIHHAVKGVLDGECERMSFAQVLARTFEDFLEKVHRPGLLGVISREILDQSRQSSKV